MENYEKKQPSSFLKKSMIDDINETSIENAMMQIKTENFKKIVHNIYIISCMLILFISLFFLNHNQFLFSSLCVLSITLLHFKYYMLNLLYNLINICEDDKTQ